MIVFIGLALAACSLNSSPRQSSSQWPPVEALNGFSVLSEFQYQSFYDLDSVGRIWFDPQINLVDLETGQAWPVHTILSAERGRTVAPVRLPYITWSPGFSPQRDRLILLSRDGGHIGYLLDFRQQTVVDLRAEIDSEGLRFPVVFNLSHWHPTENKVLLYDSLNDYAAVLDLSTNDLVPIPEIGRENRACIAADVFGWSTTGKYIGFLCVDGRNPEIPLYRIAYFELGVSEEQLHFADIGEFASGTLWASWASDRDTLLLFSAIPNYLTYVGPMLPLPDHAHLYDVSTGQITTTVPISTRIYPQWSPTGELIAYSSNLGNICFMNPSASTDGCHDLPTRMRFRMDELNYMWSRDGNYIMLRMSMLPGESGLWGMPTVMVMDTDGNPVTNPIEVPGRYTEFTSP